MKGMSGKLQNFILFLCDLVLCAIAYVFIILLAFPVSKFLAVLITYIPSLGAGIVVLCLVLFLLGSYHTEWIHASVKEYVALLTGCILAGIVSIMLSFVFRSWFLYPKLEVGVVVITTALVCAVRSSIRVWHAYPRRKGRRGKRALIVGAGELAVALLRDINSNDRLHYSIIGLVDDDPAKQNQTVHGVKVLGTRKDIDRICSEYGVEEILVAIHRISPREMQKILEICAKTKSKTKILSGVADSLQNVHSRQYLREVEIEDLLERDTVQLDNQQIEKEITGKTVLVTGAGGSIGSELCRQITKFSPKLLVLLDIYENTTYTLEKEFEEKRPNQKIEVEIASVRDKKRLDDIFAKYKPDIVFHAAAHKHVPLMETSPGEAIKNNVFGTYNVAMCAEQYGTKRFVLISTDKAVNPTNIMGATKRMCEMIVQTLQKKNKTEYVAVRFGNVLGSNGSVIPHFKKQIESGGPVTVTHPRITRYFMTIPEAAQLVLQAAAYAHGGEIFVLDMGKPVRIYDLAKKMIQLSGLRLKKDIHITFTGLRPGEKLYEELLMGEEGLQKTAHSKIFVGKPLDISEAELTEKLAMLQAVEDAEPAVIRETVKKVIPTYHCKQ